MTVRVRLLGRPRVEVGEGQPRPQPRGRKSWALLARVALAERAVRRAVLASELFGAADDPLAALRWGLADLRRSLDLPGLLRGDPLGVMRCELLLDVWALEDGSLPGPEIGGLLLGRTAMSGFRPTSASPNSSSLRASMPASCLPFPPGCTTTPQVPTCRNPAPGHWSIKPDPAIPSRLPWPAQQQSPSTTPRCTRGSGP